MRLTWNDCDLDRDLLTLRETKTGRDQTVRINATVARLLKSLPTPIDRSQLVFQREDKPAYLDGDEAGLEVRVQRGQGPGLPLARPAASGGDGADQPRRNPV